MDHCRRALTFAFFILSLASFASAENQSKDAILDKTHSPLILQNSTCGKRDETISEQEALGRAAFERQDFTSAIAAFDDAIKMKPTSEAFIGRAAAKGALGDLHGAIDDLTASIKYQPDEYAFVLALSARGTYYYQLGDLNHAIGDFTSALDVDPKNCEALYARSTVWLDAGNNDMATNDITASITLKPDNADSYVLRSCCRHANKDWQGAIADADKAISLAPDDVTGYDARGFAHFGKAEYQQALADFDRAIQIDESKSGLAIIGKCILLTTCPQQTFRDSTEAIRLAKRLCGNAETHESRRISILATVYAQMGDFEDAITWQHKAVAAATPERSKAETCRLERFKRKLPLYAPDGSDINRAFSEWRR